MTGWRIGWLVLPEDLVRPVERLAQNLFISAPHIAQVAAEAAFDCTRRVGGATSPAIAARAICCCAALPGAGFPRSARPRARSTCLPTSRDRTNDSEAFCARMLAEAGVAAAPGVDFDRARGSRFVRFSYCGPEADMREAAERLARWTHSATGG